MKLQLLQHITFITLCLMIIVAPSLAAAKFESYGQSDSITSRTAVYSSTLDGSYKFGQIAGTLNEQGNSQTILTLGRTAHTESVTVSAATSNVYKNVANVDTLGMINFDATSGITDLKSNRPDVICDAAGNIVAMDSNLSTSRYPSEQRVSGKFSSMASGNVQLDSTTGTVDDTMINDLYVAADQGYAYRDFHSSAIKGFNKSDTSYGYENDIIKHDNTQINSSTGGYEAGYKTSYTGFKDAYNKVLNTTTVDGYASNKTVVDNQTSQQAVEDEVTNVNATSSE